MPHPLARFQHSGIVLGASGEQQIVNKLGKQTLDSNLCLLAAFHAIIQCKQTAGGLLYWTVYFY